jgi:hypothetical protein
MDSSSEKRPPDFCLAPRPVLAGCVKAWGGSLLFNSYDAVCTGKFCIGIYIALMEKAKEKRRMIDVLVRGS